MTAIPVANTLGWQASLASWGVLSLVAVVPWVLQLLKMRRTGQVGVQVGAATTPAVQKLGLAQLATSPVALGTALFYAMASLNIYAMLACLPTILQEHSGLDHNAVGLAFSIYTFITPLIANKLENPISLAILLASAGPIGYQGIIFGVCPAWLMTLVAGLAGGAFPLAIAMFNLRTCTTMDSAAMAGFAMGIGYLAGTLGPLLGGWLYAITGRRTAALWVYAASVVPMAAGGLMMALPGRHLETGSSDSKDLADRRSERLEMRC